MDVALIAFGLGVGILVGMTGIGGGSLMTPMLILVWLFERSEKRRGQGVQHQPE